MSDNLRRKLQDIALGSADEPVPLPSALIARAASRNRFALVVKTVNPRKQNLRAVISQLPKIWGVADVCIGRVIGDGKAQFVFQNEAALNLVLTRGPWAFNEWMLSTHRWYPNLTDDTLKIIPFWIQIRGIPMELLYGEMVNFIGETLGEVAVSEFDDDANQLDFARVKINWNIDDPLRFQKNFQFAPDENTLLKFRFERLRNFCANCGMLTHDIKECPLSFDNNDDGNDEDPDCQDGNDDDTDGLNDTEKGNGASDGGIDATGDGTGSSKRARKDENVGPVAGMEYVQAAAAVPRTVFEENFDVMSPTPVSIPIPLGRDVRKVFKDISVNVSDVDEEYGPALSPIRRSRMKHEANGFFEKKNPFVISLPSKPVVTDMADLESLRKSFMVSEKFDESFDDLKSRNLKKLHEKFGVDGVFEEINSPFLSNSSEGISTSEDFVFKSNDEKRYKSTARMKVIPMSKYNKVSFNRHVQVESEDSKDASDYLASVFEDHELTAERRRYLEMKAIGKSPELEVAPVFEIGEASEANRRKRKAREAIFQREEEDEDRVALLHIRKRERVESFQDSSSFDPDFDGGAGGPVPPPYP